MDELMKQQPDIMINLSASPFDYLHAAGRKYVIEHNVARYRIPMVYCNTVGSQTEIVFDGGSVAVNKDGSVAAALPYFEESLTMIEWHADGSFTTEAPAEQPGKAAINPNIQELQAEANTEQIHKALLLGIKDYFGKMGFGKAIVASSEGIDSAVTLALACEALGAENVTALLLPSHFSTAHSVDDAVKLSQNLGNPYETIPIKGVFDAYTQALLPVFKDLPFSLAVENLQSRIRGGMVMALANKFGYILLNTSNKSELATGYGTLYGDMAGGLGVLGDLYKLQVYALARYINRNGEIIPENIITKPPSAELRPEQKDSDSLPEYDVLDPVLYQYIERRMGPREIILMGYDAALVSRVLRLVNTNEYKRNQFCPIIRISPKAFGVGRRMPIVGKYLV
jgi:NAD+ synthase (glutamine-hydrolysing)